MTDRLERTKEAARGPTHEDERRLEERSDYTLFANARVAGALAA